MTSSHKVPDLNVHRSKFKKCIELVHMWWSIFEYIIQSDRYHTQKHTPPNKDNPPPDKDSPPPNKDNSPPNKS